MTKFVLLIKDYQNSSINDSVYDVVTKKERDELGKVYFYKHWKKYVFEPNGDTFYDSKCMIEIAKLMEEL